MLSRDRVVDAAYPVLGERPEPFNCLGVHIPTHVDLRLMHDPLVLVALPLQLVVQSSFVCEHDGGWHNVRDEGVDVRQLRRCNDRTNPTTTLYSAQHSGFLRRVSQRPSASLSAAGLVQRLLTRLISRAPTNVGFVNLNFARQGGHFLIHQLAPDKESHSPRCLVGDAQLAFDLLSGDAATSAGHQVHRVEPQVQRRRGLVEDRSGSRVQVRAASRARPRLALLRRLVSLERTLRLAFRTVGVLTVFRVAVAPQPFKASDIVGKLAHELHKGVARLRGFGSYRFVSVDWRHDYSLLLRTVYAF